MESPDRPVPPMGAVLQSKLYTDEVYASIRHQLLAKRFKADVVEGTSEDVVALLVQGRGEGDCRNLLRMYAPHRCNAIPQNVVQIDVCMAVHECEPLRDPPHHHIAAGARGALSVLWGKAEDVVGASTRMAGPTSPRRTVDVQLYVRGGYVAMSDHTAGSYLLRISGFTGHFRARV